MRWGVWPPEASAWCLSARTSVLGRAKVPRSALLAMRGQAAGEAA